MLSHPLLGQNKGLFNNDVGQIFSINDHASYRYHLMGHTTLTLTTKQIVENIMQNAT